MLERGARPTRIVSVEAERGDPEDKDRAPITNFIALLELAKTARILLHERTEYAAVDERLMVSAVMDLNGDGRQELWIEGHGTDEHVGFVVEYGDGVQRRLSRWWDCESP